MAKFATKAVPKTAWAKALALRMLRLHFFPEFVEGIFYFLHIFAESISKGGQPFIMHFSTPGLQGFPGFGTGGFHSFYINLDARIRFIAFSFVVYFGVLRL